MNISNEHLTIILLLLFLIVTFLQSGFDKIIDWRGNVDFITNHFKESPLKKQVPLLLGVIFVVEVIAGFLMFFGIYQIIVYSDITYAIYGLQLSAVTLIFLLIGQRLAKDYVGAMSLTVYFILNIFGLFLTTFN